MPPPPRLSGTTPFPHARNPGATHSVPVQEVLKARILVKLQDRFDAAKSRRMPASLLHESARQQIEQVVEAEAHRLTPDERDKLIEDIHAELFGFGPLNELFADPAVKEVAVLGPQAVIVRRDQGWVPTNVKFRDGDHLLEMLSKVRGHGEPIGGSLPPSMLDVKLTNGFRAVGVIPPAALGQSPTVAFVRSSEPPAKTPAPAPAVVASPSASVASGLGSGAYVAIGPSAMPPHTPHPADGRGTAPTPPAPAGRQPASGESPLERHRVRITGLLIARLSNLGVYDLTRLGTAEFRKVVAAYVTEYCQLEKIYLSDADQGRLTLEILAGMNR